MKEYISTSPISISHTAKGKRPATEEATPSPPMTRSRQRQAVRTEEPTAPAAPTGGRVVYQPVHVNEQGMLNLADTVDKVWNILRGMERYIHGMDRE